MGPAPNFDEVYRAHVGLVWRSLARAGVPESMLEDATQEVFLIYHRRQGEFRGESSTATWLCGIARGVAANVRRGEQRGLRRLASRRAEPDARGPSSPEQALRKAEAQALVERFLAGQSPERAEVFALIEIEGLKQREVAEITGVSINTVGSRLRAARAAFAEFVAELRRREVASA